MSNKAVAEAVFNALAAKGAGVGNASIRIIERVLDEHYPQPKPASGFERSVALEDVITKIRRGDYEAGPRGIRQREEQRAERKRLYEQFEADAINATGLTGHPKAKALYDYAWGIDSSAGLEEVLNTLAELAEIML